MNIHDFKVTAQDGSEVSRSDYKGKVLLIVNTATGCGFTPQYQGLQELYDACHDQGLEILDFPCNQFGEQAHGSNEEIHSFCTGRFGITFSQFARIDVNGENTIPLYKWLTVNTKFEGFGASPLTLVLKGVVKKMDKDYKNNGNIKWNFTKFLTSREGEILFLDSGTLIPVLKKLESKGLVSRQRSTEDERNLVATITHAGKVLKEKAVAVPEAIAKYSNIAPEEAAMLYRILYKILGKGDL